MNERALLLGQSHPVVAVVTEPSSPDPSRPVIILSNSGIVHRVGPARLYVRIARRLAERGFVTVRLDHRGIGDSDPRHDTLPFFSAACEEVREVMDDLAARRGVERFVIMGLCSGADIAFYTAGVDDRVVGVGLVNGGGLVGHPDWMKFMQRRAYAKRYLRESIYRRERWVRVLTGRIQYRELLGVVFQKMRGRLDADSEDIEQHVQSLADRFQRLVDREAHVLMVHSGGDLSIDHRDVILGDRLPALTATGRFRDETIEGADHTFTLLEKQAVLIGIVMSWAIASWGGAVEPGPEDPAAISGGSRLNPVV